MIVKWTSNAIKSFNETIEFIGLKWTEKEIEKFILLTELTIDFIISNPYMFIATEKDIQI